MSRIRDIRPDVEFWGGGGQRMRNAGVDLVSDMSGFGTIGISETIKALPRISTRYFRLRRELLRRRPDIFVPIDFGAFNIRLGQIAHRNGIRVVYYFPPSSWRKRLGNWTKLAACGGRVITPFPWSADLLQAQGIDARFVGHPLLDIAKPSMDRPAFLREVDLSDSFPLVGLFPGSRSHEIREHLKPMLESALIIDRETGGAQFVIGAAPGTADAISTSMSNLLCLPGAPVVRVVSGRTYDCMAHSDLVITSSGTATLEAAILGAPMVIIYKGSPVMRLEFRLRRGVLEEFIGMPNIIAGRTVCQELIDDQVTARNISDSALALLRDKPTAAKMRTELAEVRSKLGKAGAIERAAAAVLELGEAL